ncbi:hypothetical protein ILYODFUR_009576 [Ilyodon furcidens]|uniref:Uncharacterized protein n=1 Tax=Ilyodon furcidens TaxID=33524 RepID=A0ABV0SXR7_9TELE
MVKKVTLDYPSSLSLHSFSSIRDSKRTKLLPPGHAKQTSKNLNVPAGLPYNPVGYLFFASRVKFCIFSVHVKRRQKNTKNETVMNKQDTDEVTLPLEPPVYYRVI